MANAFSPWHLLLILAVILLLPGCARLAVSLNRAEEKGSKTALARAQAQLIRRVLRGETHYDVLDLPANSTTDEIKAARDDLARSIPGHKSNIGLRAPIGILLIN